MHILVASAGALGGLIGARLTEAGEDVTMLESNLARAKLLAESGLFLAQAGAEERCVRVRVVTSVEGLAPVDLVFLAVKSYQTEAALRAVLPVITAKTWVLSLQNGIGNVQKAAQVLGSDRRVLSGVTFHSVQHTGPNRLNYRSGIKPIQMAPLSGDVTDEVQAIGAAFRTAGIATDVAESVDRAVWQKLLHNAVVNPVAALAGLTCSELLEDEHLQAFMRKLCEEIVAVMRARGVPLEDEEDPYRPVMRSQRALGKNRPSMWQDLVRGFHTEVDAINGAVVAEAERLGLSAPLNLALVQLVHSRESLQERRKARADQTLAEVKAAQRHMPLRDVGKSASAGMPNGRVPLESAPKLKELIRDYYRDLDRASHDRGRKVAWCSGLGPSEIVRALGYTPYFPENHAALIGAGGYAAKFIRLALADGFSPFVSTEMMSDIGAVLAGESPLVAIHGVSGIPRPDVLVYSTNIGQYIARWFEYYANRMGAPLAGLHPPALLDEVEKIDVDASVRQVLRFIDRLEKSARHVLDHDRLAEVVELSARASKLWGSILDLARNVPSPITFFDTLVHLAPMVLMRGTPEAVTYYEVLLAELQQRLADKVAAVPGERWRLYWEGPPIWCALRPLAALFLEHEVTVVASSYARYFVFDGLDPANPTESLAKSYTSVFPNRSREYKAQFIAAELHKYGVDAAVYHDARTCPDLSTSRYGLHLRIKRDTGVHPLVLEADTHDSRLVSLDHLERQLVEFLEPVGDDVRLTSGGES